jgi:hypothetical protein
MPTLTPHVLVGTNNSLRFTECLLWRAGEWWFLDTHYSRIKRVNLEGTLQTAVELPFKPNLRIPQRRQHGVQRRAEAQRGDRALPT